MRFVIFLLIILLDGFSVQSEETFCTIPKKKINIKKYSASPRSDQRTFDARDKGWITVPKDQKNCKSCVAFSTVSLFETCVARLTGKMVDLSEQYLIDAAYNGGSMNGCEGTGCYFSYGEWMEKNSPDGLPNEKDYPYRPTRHHPYDYQKMSPVTTGVKITGCLVGESCNEKMLTEIVKEMGSALVSVSINNTRMRNFEGGEIFNRCSQSLDWGNHDHTFVLVGYNLNAPQPYWIVKNSWGPKWADGGYFKVPYGVNACGIGTTCVVMDCEKTK